MSPVRALDASLLARLVANPDVADAEKRDLFKRLSPDAQPLAQSLFQKRPVSPKPAAARKKTRPAPKNARRSRTR